MVRRVIVVCEGKSDFSYLNALQRFIENDLPLPAGEIDPPLRFVPCPDPYGTGTGHFDRIVETYRAAVKDFEPEPVEVWVDADIYIRNESLSSDPSRRNGDEYRRREPDIPVFFFSYHNFEDFIALHGDPAVFAKWKSAVLFARGKETGLPHKDCPLTRTEHAPHFQTVMPHYAKRRMPFPLSVARLANLRRNLHDADVRAMSALLRPGFSFGEHLINLFDTAYPGLIP